MAIEDALATWLGDQRWFAGKGQGLRDLAIVADTELVSGDPEMRHLIVAVSHATAVDYYQVLVGLRRRLPAVDPTPHQRPEENKHGQRAGEAAGQQHESDRSQAYDHANQNAENDQRPVGVVRVPCSGLAPSGDHSLCLTDAGYQPLRRRKPVMCATW